MKSFTFWIGMINISHKSPFLGAVSYFIFCGIISITYLWPSELDVILDSIFWIGLFMFLFSCLVIYFMFWTHGCSNRNVRFTFGLLLILAAATMNVCFDMISKSTAAWVGYFPRSYEAFFNWLKLFLSYAKDIIAFGIAAIGASVTASAIRDPE